MANLRPRECHRRTESHCAHGGDDGPVGPSEYYPQTDPSGEEAEVHRVTHVAIESHHHQSLRRSEGRGGSVAGVSEVPHATQGDRETEHRGQSSNPSPGRAFRVHAEAKPG